MTFSQALVALKRGKRVRRKSWPAEQWLRYSKTAIPLPASVVKALLGKWAPPDLERVTLEPTIILKTADDLLNVNWLPSSREDLLGTDWELVASPVPDAPA